MSVDCYFEDGPLAGTVQAHESALRVIQLRVRGDVRGRYFDHQDALDFLPILEDTVVEYVREDLILDPELVPSRTACVTYFERRG